MQCGKVQLQERTKNVNKVLKAFTTYRPLRYCQKRLVNPQHEEDPRWIDVLERFRCQESVQDFQEEPSIKEDTEKKEDNLFLSVQTLKFGGTEKLGKRPRTSFKYKTVTDGNVHRMFVKQVVVSEELQTDDDRSSQLTSYYYDDYAKYLSHSNRSRPSSGKSSIFLQGLSTRFKANKAVQVNLSKIDNNIKKARKTDNKKYSKDIHRNTGALDQETSVNSEKDTTVVYQKSGKRKSLTISRTQSPETVQVIRVDVVCNSASDARTNHGDVKPHKEPIQIQDNKIETVKHHSHFANKYLLTDTIKSLDEKVSGGAKVTLLCKTFSLTDRSQALFNRKCFDIGKVISKPKLNK